MNRRPRLIALVHADGVTRTLFLLLLASLLVVADGYVLILVSRLLGIYLLLAIEAATGILAVISILSSYRHTLSLVRQAVREDRYPGPEFRALACLWVAAVLLVLPGFVTDALGLASLIPPTRWLVGRLMERTLRGGFEELYEYLRLDE